MVGICGYAALAWWVRAHIRDPYPMDIIISFGYRRYTALYQVLTVGDLKQSSFGRKAYKRAVSCDDQSSDVMSMQHVQSIRYCLLSFDRNEWFGHYVLNKRQVKILFELDRSLEYVFFSDYSDGLLVLHNNYGANILSCHQIHY